MEHTTLERKMGSQHRVVLGELMHAMATARPDASCSATILSKFSSALPACHHQLLESVTKCLQITKSWEANVADPKMDF